MNGIMNKRDPIIRLPPPIQDLQWVLQLCSREDQEGLVDPQDLFHPFLLHFLQIPFLQVGLVLHQELDNHIHTQCNNISNRPHRYYHLLVYSSFQFLLGIQHPELVDKYLACFSVPSPHFADRK